MLSDEQLRELFSAYIDGDVSEQVREQIERRCDEEDELRAELDDLRAVVGALSSFPEVSAPQGFASRVLSEVEDLDIPSQHARGAASASAHDQALESLSVPMWLKGSIAASLAATLVVGFFVLRAPLKGDFHAMDSLGMNEEAVASWDVPMGTGVDELPVLPMDEAEDDSGGQLADTDGVVSVDAPEQESAAGPRQDRLTKSIQPPESARPPQQAVKGKQAAGGQQLSTRGRSRPTSKGSGLKEVTSDQTQQVYEAEHEEEQVLVAAANEPAAETTQSADQKALEDDGVVALSEKEVSPSDIIMIEEKAITIGAIQRGNGSSGSVRRGDAGPVSGAFARRSDAVGSSAVRRDSRSAKSVRAQGTDSTSTDKASFVGAEAALSASEEMVVVSEEQDEEAVDVPSIAAKVAIGTLRVSSPDVIATMSTEMTARLWSVQNLTPLPEDSGSRPAVGSQVLQIMVPEGDEDDLSRLLSSYGALNTDRLLAAAHDGNARLRLTIRWGN